jgi:YIF1
MYYFGFGNPTFCELVAYTGYKFVVMSPIALSELLLGYYYSYGVMMVCGSLFAYFFYKTLGRFNSNNSLADHINGVSLNRRSFMIGNCAA